MKKFKTSTEGKLFYEFYGINNIDNSLNFTPNDILYLGRHEKYFPYFQQYNNFVSYFGLMDKMPLIKDYFALKRLEGIFQNEEI